MRLSIEFHSPNLADGVYTVHAPGMREAAIFWADERGPLCGMTALIRMPLDADGCGEYTLGGGRAIPPEATHAALCCGERTVLYPLPDAQRTVPGTSGVRLCMMSDLHLAAKPWRIRRALEAGRDCDAILIAGDSTNDGLPAQFDKMLEMIEEAVPDTPVLAVCGNHDFPLKPLPLCGDTQYPDFQRILLERARRLGVVAQEDACGAYEAHVGGVTIFGLNAATHKRALTFARGRQLEWLAKTLPGAGDGFKVVMCHTPLRLHQPVRGKEMPYVARDKELQAIIDEAKNVIFHSGHLHITLNEAIGCAQQDERGNVYLSDSSVCPPCYRVKEPIEDPEWVEGAAVFARICEDEAAFEGHALRSGKRIARAIYRFDRRA